MCGLLGWISQKEIEPQKFMHALNTLEKRGPDGEGRWLSKDKKVALGHRRLSILSDDGAQPLTNEAENVVAIVNGEFYNYIAVRNSLEKKGHRFSTGSDSEILVHLYEEYGENCVLHLEGEFAFVLWDVDAELLFAGRDRFGVKPLVYSEFCGDFLIASKARAIMALTQHRKWDRDALFRSIHHQYAPPNRTLFDGIRSLPPGHVLRMYKGELRTKRYWDFYDLDNRPTKSLKSALHDAVEKRLQGDGSVTCSLSGGIDSSAIAAFLSSMQSNTQAFSVDFRDGSSANVERREAERVAKHLNIELNIVEINPVDVFEHLGATAFHTEGLAINAHMSAKYLLSKNIQEKNFKVVLSGEGADEIFYGYPHLRQDILGCDAKTIHTFDKVSTGVMVAGKSARTDAQIKARLGYVPSFFRAKLSLGSRVMSQTTKVMQNELGRLGPLSMLDGFVISDIPTLKARGSAYLWTKLALEKYILTTLGDGTEMAHGIEGRTPFLDVDVIQTAFGFTPDSCFKKGMEKIQLREAMVGLLPDETLARHKQPFIGPPVSFSKSAEEMVRERLRNLKGSEIWDADALMKTWQEKSKASRVEQQKWDPVFMLAFSSDEIQKQYNLDAL